MENPAFEKSKDDPPLYEETSFSANDYGNVEHRSIRPSVVSAFGHNTLDRAPNINFYRNAGSVSGQRAIRPSLQELHQVFNKVSDVMRSSNTPYCRIIHTALSPQSSTHSSNENDSRFIYDPKNLHFDK